ncbi:hypothetical protein [Microbacterium sp. W4I20]|uniref:hypothetical protein n=1 Tax=Microbacterium sp. W4I20 TaxID=3042262 RepID=UPI00277DBB28|nr:hypothetical protein [Microbacterium sp. W4I20]MDQ0726353.1 nitroreductase [Microbacterium sp. W4I20]
MDDAGIEVRSGAKDVGTEASRAKRLRASLRLISAVAIIGIVAAAVWFVFAAVAESGGQLAAASTTAAGLGAGWSAAFAAVKTQLKSIDAVPDPGAASHA